MSSTNLPISSLDPSTSLSADRTIFGIVTLLWPYSSSTRSCAFLLSDPDFRLRSRRGQVRVRFTGPGAKAVAEAHVGIGDLVELGLRGGKWGVEDAGVKARTPGRGVEGELVFAGGVGLGVWRGGVAEGVGERVEVDAPVSPPAGRERQVNGHSEAVTPALAAAAARPRPENDLKRRSLDNSFLNANGNGGGADWTYASPAFAKRVRLSSDQDSFMGSAAFDPFVDGDVDGEARSPGKKRTSFGLGLRWRLKSRTPSPVKERFGGPEGESEGEVEIEVESPFRDRRVDGILEEGMQMPAEGDTLEDVEMAETESPTRPPPPTALPTELEASREARAPERPRSSAPSSAMPPPSLLPAEERTEDLDQFEKPQQPDTIGPSTPKLESVKSPTLPLPSPFPADAPSSLSAAQATRPRPYTANSLFGALGNAASVIERRRSSGKFSQGQAQAAQPASLPLPRHEVAPAPPAAMNVKEPEVEGSAVPPAVVDVVDLTDGEDENAEMIDENHVATEGVNPNQSFSTTIADDDMYDDYERSLTATLPTEKAMVGDNDEGVTTAEQTNEISKGSIQAGEDLHTETLSEDGLADAEDTLRDDGSPIEENRSLGESSELPSKLRPDETSLEGAASAVPPPQPSPHTRKLSPPKEADERAESTAPAPATPLEKQPPGALALDGASSTPISARVTPQSEKERKRKSTYRSLFGLRSPQGEQTSAAMVEPVRQEERFIPGWFFEIEGQQKQDAERPSNQEVEVEDALVDPVDAEAQPEEVNMPNDVVMPDEVDAPDQAELQRPEPHLDDQRTPTAPQSIAPPPKLQVIELDPSSDFGEDEDEEQDAPTPKAAPSELPFSSPVIQDSLEDSPDEAFVVSENERISTRRGVRTATQKLRNEELVVTSPLSSPLPEERLAELAQERAYVDEGLTQQQQQAPPPKDIEMVSSPTPKASDLPSFEQDVEEHIAPPRSAAATTVLDLDQSSESEEFPSSPTLWPQRARGKQDQPPPSTQGPSYPTLPLSPSNSQSLNDMQSQPVIEESVRSKLPPTPQLTQRESSTRTEERSSQKTPAPKLLRNESSLRAEVQAAESPVTPQAKTPSRRSARLRTSNVPDVLSEWFSPRRSGVVSNKEGKTVQDEAEHTVPTEEDGNDVAAVVTNGHATPSKAKVTPMQTAGFATAHSYFTPLSKVQELVNPSSQHVHGTGALDILAVVTDSSKEPVRAKTGPRDYFTIFRVAHPSLPSNDSIRVEVFRPYKNTLPTAEVGDVVLLRAFVVKSKKRTPYLLSTESSAWCVWRYPDAREAGKPVWAKEGMAGAGGGVEEEVKGPPVEFGDEERAQAGRLREWWAGEKAVDWGAKGKTVEEVIAKL